MKLLSIVIEDCLWIERNMRFFCLVEKPAKLYFDLEYDIDANPTIDGPKLTTNFIQV